MGKFFSSLCTFVIYTFCVTSTSNSTFSLSYKQNCDTLSQILDLQIESIFGFLFYN